MIKVSVLIITYNQKKFIRKAIDSALEQKTTFPIEILVGDDFSSDGTREIIQEYEKKYPGLVIGVLHPRNLGKNGGINFLDTLKLAKGEYYALMDGDDYWTDPLKLQKQADFLDAHPDYSTVFNNALITYEDGAPSHLLNGPDMKPFYTVDDLIGESEIWFMATSSTMYRNNIKEYPSWFRESSSGDIPRLILKAKLGKIGYIPDVMSVYRKNRAGASFHDNERDETFLRNRIQMYRDINRELDYRYDSILRRNIARYYRMMLDAKQYEGSYFRRARLALKYIYLGKPDWEKTKDVIRDYIVPEPISKLYSSLRLLPHR
ncbi:glycosyltransferase family 2 protein [Spirosoma jeollabukense]